MMKQMPPLPSQLSRVQLLPLPSAGPSDHQWVLERPPQMAQSTPGWTARMRILLALAGRGEKTSARMRTISETIEYDFILFSRVGGDDAIERRLRPAG